jgi:hypothetical protein
MLFYKKTKKGLERIDSKVDFDFANESPHEGISLEQFCIAWDGSMSGLRNRWLCWRRNWRQLPSLRYPDEAGNAMSTQGKVASSPPHGSAASRRVG